MGRASTPLKVLSNGDLRAFTEAEERYLAFEAGRYFSGLDSSDGGLLTASSTNAVTNNVSVGGFVNSEYDQSVGGRGTLTTTETQHPLYQNLQLSSARPAKGSDFRNLISWDYTLGGIKEMDDDDLTTLGRRLSKTIIENEYPGTFRLSASSPGSDWIEYKSNYYADTRTDGTTVYYSLWLRTQGQSANAHTGRVLPATLKRSSGSTGSYSGFQRVSDTQLSNTLGTKIRDVLGEQTYGTGNYRLISSSQPAPSPGTWVSRGTVTDTRQEVVQSDYVSTSTPGFVGDFVGDFVASSNFQSTRGSITSVNYVSSATQNFVGDYTANFVGSITSTSTNESVSSTEDFVGDYTANYVGSTNSTSTNVSVSSTKDFVGDYIADYTGSQISTSTNVSVSSTAEFIADFTGNYISSTNSTATSTNVTSQTDFVGDFVGDFTGSAAVEKNRTQTRITDYTGNFVGDFTGSVNSTSATESVGSTTDFTGDYIADYTGSTDYVTNSTSTTTDEYAGNFTGDFTGSAASTNTFTADYVATFVGDFTGSTNYVTTSTQNFTAEYLDEDAFIGNFTGSTDSTSLTDSTYVGNFHGTFIGDFTGSTLSTTPRTSAFTGESTISFTGDFQGLESSLSGYPTDTTAIQYQVITNFTGTGQRHSHVLNWRISQPVVLQHKMFNIPVNSSTNPATAQPKYKSIKFRINPASNITILGMAESVPTSNNYNNGAQFIEIDESSFITQIVTSHGFTFVTGYTCIFYVTYNVNALGSYTYNIQPYEAVNRSDVTVDPRDANAFGDGGEEDVSPIYVGSVLTYGTGTTAQSGTLSQTTSTQSFTGNFISTVTDEFVGSQDYQRENAGFRFYTSTLEDAFLANYISSANFQNESAETTTQDFQSEYIGNYTGSVNSTANDESTGSTTDFLGNFTGSVNSTADDESISSTTDFIADFTGDYTGSVNSTVNDESTSTGEYVATFLADYTGSADFASASTSDFTGNFVGDFVGNYISSTNSTANSTSSFVVDFISDYLGDFISSAAVAKNSTSTTTDEYSGNFLGDFTGSTTYAANTESTRTSTYAGNFVGDFISSAESTANTLSTRTSTYAGNFVGDFTGSTEYATNTESTRTSTYTGNYLGFSGAEYLGDYQGARSSTAISTATSTDSFVGDYAASTIAATSEVIETYTLYVRIE